MPNCNGCNTQLPLKAAEEGEVSFVWTCKECGEEFVGILDDRFPDDITRRVRLTLFRFGNNDTSFFKKGESAVRPTGDRRACPRTSFGMTIPVIPLNHSQHPDGLIFLCKALNISATGIAMLSQSPVIARFLALQIPDLKEEPIQVIAEVIRCTLNGGGYLIGCRFLERTHG